MTASFDLRALEFAKKVAELSKDPSTKVGAVFFNHKKTSPITFGYNGMLRGLPDNNPERNARPEKYYWYEHAERNAIYNLAQKYTKDTFIFCTHEPTIENIRAIISSGIKHIVIDAGKLKNSRSMKMLELTGVKVLELSGKQHDNKYSIKLKKYMELTRALGDCFPNNNPADNSGILTSPSAMILNKHSYTPVSCGNGGSSKIFSTLGIKIAPEKESIFNLVYPEISGSTVYISWFPCSMCAASLAAVGVIRVVTYAPRPTNESDIRWFNEFDKAQSIFEELGIELTAY